MEWWHIYLFTRLDGLNMMMMILIGASLVGLIWCGIISFTYCGSHTSLSEDEKIQLQLRAKLPRLVIGWFLLLLVAIAIPSQKEAAAIYLLPKLAHSDFAKEAQQIPTNAAKIMRLKLESWITDMEPTKVEKK